MHTIQNQTWEENDKFIFNISDEINSNLFLLEEARSIRCVPPEHRRKPTQHCDYITGLWTHGRVHVS